MSCFCRCSLNIKILHSEQNHSPIICLMFLSVLVQEDFTAYRWSFLNVIIKERASQWGFLWTDEIRYQTPAGVYSRGQSTEPNMHIIKICSYIQEKTEFIPGITLKKKIHSDADTDKNLSWIYSVILFQDLFDLQANPLSLVWDEQKAETPHRVEGTQSAPNQVWKMSETNKLRIRIDVQDQDGCLQTFLCDYYYYYYLLLL